MGCANNLHEITLVSTAPRPPKRYCAVVFTVISVFGPPRAETGLLKSRVKCVQCLRGYGSCTRGGNEAETRKDSVGQQRAAECVQQAAC
jgi:hypothetical protein